MDEVATVIVEVRSITSRPVRKRGMKPLVTAVVADATGSMEATFFNQPWLQRKYAPGTRLLLSGKYQARNRFRVQFHAETGEAVGAAEEDMATYPATDGLSTTQILALAAPVARRRAGVAGAAARAAAGDRAAARPRRGAGRGALRRPRGRPAPARLRGAAARADRAAAPARAAPGGRARRAAGAAGRADPRLAAGLAAVHPHGRPALRDGAWSTTTSRNDRPMQRLLMGEVGSGKTVVALYAMLRAVESGAQAALMAPTETLAEQHFATLQALMPGALVQAALLTGSTPGARRDRPARQARLGRAEAAGRHARADRGGGRLRPPRRGRGGRAAPLRRQPAPRAGPQGAGRASRRTCCT